MITAIDRRIEDLLKRWKHWRSWSKTLAAAHKVAEYRKKPKGMDIIYSHVDTSEVIQFVLPDDSTPTEIRVSLELLFAHKVFPLYLLPTHARELRNKTLAFDAELRSFIYGTRQFSMELRQLLANAIGNRARKKRSSYTEEVARIITENVPLEEALEADRQLSAWTMLTSLFEKDIVRFANVKQISVGQSYKQDKAHYNVCFESLKSERPNAERRNRYDAEALDFLQWLNSVLPEGRIAILYTRTSAIYNIVDEIRKSDEDYLIKEGVPLVQSPVARLVNFALFEDPQYTEKETLAEHLALARAEGLGRSPKAIEALKQPHTGSQEITNAYLDKLDRIYDKTREAYESWAKAAAGRMLVDTERHRPTQLSKFLFKPEFALNPRQLLEGFDRLLEECARKVEAGRSRVYASVFPDAPWDETEQASQGSRRSFAQLSVIGSPQTEFEFRSPPVRQLHDSIEAIRSGDEFNKTVQIRLELIARGPQLQTEPEYHLLLSWVFGLFQDGWLQAYDSAEQGLRLLGYSESAKDLELESVRVEQEPREHLLVRRELKLARAIALGRWGSGQSDKESICTLVMKRAVSELLDYLSENSGGQARGGGKRTHDAATPDFRALRELSFLYGEAHEYDLALPLPGKKSTTQPKNHKMKLLSHAVRYARQALSSVTKSSVCYRYLVNNLLYGLTKLAKEQKRHLERHLEERKDLAAILEVEEVSEAALCHTLSEHYEELARFEANAELKAAYKEKANTFLDQAQQLAPKADRVHRLVIERDSGGNKCEV